MKAYARPQQQLNERNKPLIPFFSNCFRSETRDLQSTLTNQFSAEHQVQRLRQTLLSKTCSKRFDSSNFDFRKAWEIPIVFCSSTEISKKVSNRSESDRLHLLLSAGSTRFLRCESQCFVRCTISHFDLTSKIHHALSIAVRRFELLRCRLRAAKSFMLLGCRVLRRGIGGWYVCAFRFELGVDQFELRSVRLHLLGITLVTLIIGVRGNLKVALNLNIVLSFVLIFRFLDSVASRQAINELFVPNDVDAIAE